MKNFTDFFMESELGDEVLDKLIKVVSKCISGTPLKNLKIHPLEGNWYSIQGYSSKKVYEVDKDEFDSNTKKMSDELVQRAYNDVCVPIAEFLTKKIKQGLAEYSPKITVKQSEDTESVMIYIRVNNSISSVYVYPDRIFVYTNRKMVGNKYILCPKISVSIIGDDHEAYMHRWMDKTQ